MTIYWLQALLCRVKGHDWRPFGLVFRACQRCGSYRGPAA